MATVLLCYLRNSAFKVGGVDYHAAADLTGQANHLGATIRADVVKQRLATNNGGHAALNSGDSSYGKFDTAIGMKLTGSDEQGHGGHPVDLVRYGVLNCYAGRVPLINSGSESKGQGDLAAAVRTAVINKRAGGSGLIPGRKAFQRPMAENGGGSTPSGTSISTSRSRSPEARAYQSRPPDRMATGRRRRPSSPPARRSPERPGRR